MANFLILNLDGSSAAEASNRGMGRWEKGSVADIFTAMVNKQGAHNLIFRGGAWKLGLGDKVVVPFLFMRQIDQGFFLLLFSNSHWWLRFFPFKNCHSQWIPGVIDFQFLHCLWQQSFFLFLVFGFFSPQVPQVNDLIFLLKP